MYSQARREALGLPGTAELLSNTLTLLLATVQWILSFLMDTEPTYVIGSGTLQFQDMCTWVFSKLFVIVVAGWWFVVAIGWLLVVVDIGWTGCLGSVRRHWVTGSLLSIG